MELGLRLWLGLGTPLLYIAHPQIGYLLAPNQKVKRKGNWIEINQYSMRSRSISPLPSPNCLRVLLLGDSVANGSWWTPQTETISALIEELFLGKTGHDSIEVLNASANSWGPRNQLAYIQAFGTFGAELVVVLLNTDDLFAQAPSSAPVGQDSNYPAVSPGLALLELWRRFVWRIRYRMQRDSIQIEGGDIVEKNLNSLQQINQIVKQKNKYLLVAMTPLLREIAPLEPREYEKIARSRLEELTREQNISYINFLPLFNSEIDPPNLYRDHIHLSSQGNQIVAQKIVEKLLIGIGTEKNHIL